MKEQTYQIEGMTCNGCRTRVENAIKNLQDLDDVEVDLEKQRAVLRGNRKISISEIQEVLPEKYTVKKSETQNNEHKTDHHENSPEPLWKKLKPLFLILVYIVTTAVLLNIESWNSGNFMLDYIGLFFIVFSFFKMLDLSGFARSFSMYDPLAKRVALYARIYPFIELILGLLFLRRLETKIALVVTVIILGITTIGVARVLLDKKSIQCACLGSVLKLPMTKATLIENTIMLVMSGIMLVFF